MILPLLRMGDPRLLRVAEAVTDFGSTALVRLVADMEETMAAAGGVGLAAPQVGVNQRLVIFGFEKSERYPGAMAVPYTVLINPVLTPLSGEEEEGWEGCLSVPGLRGWVPRWKRLRYQGFGLDGKTIEREVEGFHARVVQHECDHLDGLLYPMRVRDFRRFGFVEELFPDGLGGGSD